MTKQNEPSAGEKNTGDDIDARLTGESREGLTGTAAANVYAPVEDRERVTRAPDGRPMEQQPAWRQDFPIDVPQDNFVARRDFMKFLVLTSLAFAAGQFVIGNAALRRGQKLVAESKKIASLRDLAIGQTITFTYPTASDPCVLTRLDEKTLVAYSQKCTHLSCAVIPNAMEGVIHCPCHEGLFELKTGRPLAGPPRRPLPVITLELRDDDIYATGVQGRTV